MRLFQYQFSKLTLCVLNVLIAILLLMAFVTLSLAEEMTPGEMRGIIRSAGHPCARVLDLHSTGDSSWRVQCNSGGFNVTRTADGQFIVKTS